MKDIEMKWEAICKMCGNYEPFGSDEELESWRQYSVKEGERWPKHCGRTMKIGQWKKRLIESCSSRACKTAYNKKCACWCEGTFHQIERINAIGYL